MMTRRLAFLNQPIPDAYGKRQVRQSIAMQVAKFPSADAKLDAAKPMGGGGDARPGRDFPEYLFVNALSHARLPSG
jgi:hypothetical protein